jgi:hypothetical protein
VRENRGKEIGMEEESPVLIGYRSDGARIDVFEDEERYSWTVTDHLGQIIEQGQDCGTPETAMNAALETDPVAGA